MGRCSSVAGSKCDSYQKLEMTNLSKPTEAELPFDFLLHNPIEDGEIVESPKSPKSPKSPETRVDWDFCPEKRKFVTGDDRKVLLVSAVIDADLAAAGRGSRMSLSSRERTVLWNDYMQRMFPRPKASEEERLAKRARMHACETARCEKRVREAGNVTYTDEGVSVDHWMARKY